MNDWLRLKARGSGVPLWRIAQEIGISEPTLTRWLRVPLQEERRKLIMEAIDKLSDGGLQDEE